MSRWRKFFLHASQCRFYSLNVMITRVMNASWHLIVQDSQNLELGGDGDMLIEIGATWIVPRRLDMSMSVGRR